MMNEMSVVQRFSNILPVDVSGLIQALGIHYSEEPMPSENSGRIEKNGETFRITVNSSEGPQRRRFTAAHELGHYLLHRDLLTDGTHFDRLFNSAGYVVSGEGITPSHEVQANQFAANLLMPAKRLRSDYNAETDNVRELAEACEVSPQAMRIRLKSLGLRA